MMKSFFNIFIVASPEFVPHRDDSVVRIFASHAVGCVFLSPRGHTKDHHANGTICLPAWLAGGRVGV